MADELPAEAVTVQELDAAVSVSDDDVLPIGQGPSDLKKATVSQLRSRLLGGAANAATATEAANAAAEAANAAAEAANDGVSQLTVTIDQAVAATVNAGNAATRASGAADNAEAQATAAEDAANAATAAAASTNGIVTDAVAATNNANDKAALANTAAETATTVTAQMNDALDRLSNTNDTATASATAASDSADAAAASALSAEHSATDADASKTSAAASATAASASEVNADVARVSAESARDTAVAAKDLAVDPLSDLQASVNAITADPENAVSEIYIPATMMLATIPSPSNATPATLVKTSRMTYWSLPKISGQIKLETTIKVPSHWSSVIVNFVMANPNSYEGNIAIGVYTYSHADGDDLSATPPTGLGQAASVSSSAFVQFTRPAYTGTLPVDPSKITTFTFMRTGNSSYDTLGSEIYLLGVRIQKAD